MGIGARIKKRILIFLLIPILMVIPFITDDLELRVIAALILIIYVGFIIFLRDSRNTSEPFNKNLDGGVDNNLQPNKDKEFQTDEDEEFKIISNNKNVEVLTADAALKPIKPTVQDFYKPPDLKKNYIKIANEKFPDNVGQDEQFGFVLEKILYVAKEAFLAHSSIFFWYNQAKKRFTLERFVSSSTNLTKQKYDLENDILSKIIQNGEPELLTDITPNAERDVIRYYNSPQGIKSFVGVPLFYGDLLAGVIVLDSKVRDAFGMETIYSLGRFVRVISIIISLFEEKFSESRSKERLNALLNVLRLDKDFSDEKELFNTIEKAVKYLIQWDAFAFVYFNPKEHEFKTARVVNKTSLKYVGKNLKVELEGTLVGKTIISGTPVMIADTSVSENKITRFSKSEDVNFDGSFLAIPLVYDNKNYGVICFESLKKNVYTNSDIKFLQSALKIFAFIVYSYSTQATLKNLLSVDVETHTLNYETFFKNLQTDLIKAKECQVSGAIAIIEIDEFLEQESLFEGDPFPKVLNAIVEMVKEEMTPLNIFGRISKRVFGIYFFNSSTKDVFLWSEKLRIKIARKPISVIAKQTTFTVSIGVASTNNKTDTEEVLKNAGLALKKALEKGGNTVVSVN